ncbi:MAG: hypothetical protein ABJM43_19685 [Paracoccaceae bacterium]
MSKKERDARVTRALDLVELGPQVKRRPADLSDGDPTCAGLPSKVKMADLRDLA